MGEAIMASVGRSGVLPGVKKKLITRIFTSNDTFVFPGNVVNNEIHVLCYGGGGGSGNKAGGGGGGWLNYIVLNNIASQTLININIGKGGVNYRSGGTTAFGNFVSAAGGSSGGTNGNINWGGWINFRFSGSGKSYRGSCNGGSGGSGGGGMYLGRGGTGYQFGGGGSGSMEGYINDYNAGSNINKYKIVNYTSADAGSDYNADAFNYTKGGDGGEWGGGGGGGVVLLHDNTIYIARGGNGGKYGGNGSGYEDKASDGFPVTIKYFPEFDNYVDNHKAGIHDIFGGCGGGGYGGAGGNGSKFTVVNNGISAPGAGGGGGYYAKGGDGHTSCYYSSIVGWYYNSASGGGGGYGGNGADGNYMCGGGGGGYGPSNYGAGGGGTAINGLNGKDGICIIQYYEMVME